MTQVIDRVEARLDESWSLERMADEARFSSFHFHRLLKDATGETPVGHCQVDAAGDRVGR